MDFSRDREACRITTCYEVWRYFGHNREYRELIGRDVNTGSALVLLGRLTVLRQLAPLGQVDFDAGHAKWGMEFLDAWGRIEYWCVIEKQGVV